MVINSSDASGQNALTSSLLQLSLEDVIAAIGLCRVSLERILILLGVKVSARNTESVSCWNFFRIDTEPEPICLSGHGTKRRQQEILPLFEIYQILRRVARRTDSITQVINTTDVVHACSGFPRDDAGVWIFDGRKAPVLIDFEILCALNTLLGIVTELPLLRCEWDVERLERHGDLDWVRARRVGVED